MSTFSLPPLTTAQATSPQIDPSIAAVDSLSSVDEEGEFLSGPKLASTKLASTPVAVPHWFALGIEKHNAALFQAACMAYRPQLSDAVRDALETSQRSVTETEFSLIIGCLIDVAFDAAEQSQERWQDFTDEDRVDWLRQFADAAIEYFDTL